MCIGFIGRNADEQEAQRKSRVLKLYESCDIIVYRKYYVVFYKSPTQNRNARRVSQKK